MSFGESFSFERPHSKKGAPACGVYLIMPKKLYIRQFEIQLRRAFGALNASPYERNMHALELRFPKKIFERQRQEASAIVEICKRNGIVPIVRGDVGLCVECNADGLLAADVEQLKQARNVLGEQAIIGMECGNSREKAESAMEAGADYVTFDKFFSRSKTKSAELSLLEWWSTKTALPAVAIGGLEPNQAIALVKAGAGFLGAENYVWDHEEGPARAVYWLQEAIEHGLMGNSLN